MYPVPNVIMYCHLIKNTLNKEYDEEYCFAENNNLCY